MTEILSLFSGGWSWVVGIAVAAMAFVLSYFGGKKVGTVQTQAKADVAAAQKEQQQVQATAKIESENIKVVKSVQQENASVSDTAARSKLQQSKYNSAD